MSAGPIERKVRARARMESAGSAGEDPVPWAAVAEDAIATAAHMVTARRTVISERENEGMI
jgi:hypothetical protein